MKYPFVAISSVTIQAPAVKVWDALVNPELVKQYLFGTEMTIDLRKGGDVIYRGEWEGKAYEDRGTILEIEPGKMLKMTYWSSMSGSANGPEEYQEITYSLQENHDSVDLTITQANIESDEKRQHSEKNWSYVLGVMKGLIEAV